MANEATAELYRRQSGLNKAKLNTDYEQYLADLATKYGISQDQLNSNLESRGILRSGEAGTAQARLGGANEAARTSAKTTYDYNTATEDVDLATKLAGLMAGTPSTGGGTTPAPTTPTTPTTLVVDTTPRVDAPLPSTAPVVYRGGNTQGQLPQAPLPTASPRPVATPAPTQGQLPSGIDFSGVDFAALGRAMEAKKKSVVYGGGTSQGQLPQAALPTATTRPGRGAR
jgi:cytoskeletal protein RodZ